MRTIKEQGLTSIEAAEFLKQYGKNEVIGSQTQGLLQQFYKIILDPMGLMMLGLAVLYYFTGETTDASIILCAYVPVVTVDVFLELRSEKALNALKSNLQSKVKVFRDGVLQDISTQLIVPGDLIAFEEGQSLPADGVVIDAFDFSVSEASLTGESLPVEKGANAEFFAGTTVLKGRGHGRILKTGQSTRFGKIGILLAEAKAESTPLQRKINALVKKVIFVASVLVLILFAMEYFRGGEVMNSLITALTFGMAVIPEEFPLVFTLYLSMGAWRLAKKGVLVKTLPSVESLGGVDVICTDKTGTLTEGRFQLVSIIPSGSLSINEVSEISLLACEPIPVDSMDLAIVEKLIHGSDFRGQWSLTYDYPFETDGKHMTHVWTDAQGRQVLAMKGAVEGVLEHCFITESGKKEIENHVRTLSAQGKRILGVATRNGSFSGNRVFDEKNVQFAGLLVFSDPIRSSAKQAIEDCQKSGIEIKMLTGDYHLTAHAIADELNIIHSDKTIFSGSQLARMDNLSRQKAFLEGSIFARVTPEQKFEMVQTLKESGKVVAMTGDGVNDSPALKLADVGVSMGENATDVARSAAKMVLLKNDFNGLVHAVFEGRSIFANLRRSFAYLISFHIPIVILALLPPMFGWPQLLLPIHIILLQIIVHPVSAFAFENLPSPHVSNRNGLVPFTDAVTASLSGLLLGLLSMSALIYFDGNADPRLIRSFMVATLLYGSIGFMYVEVWPNFKSLRAAIIAAVLLVLPFGLCEISFMTKAFHTMRMESLDYLTALAFGIFASLPRFLFRFKKAT
jgi:Ca2+-transporting ATPase